MQGFFLKIQGKDVCKSAFERRIQIAVPSFPVLVKYRMNPRFSIFPGFAKMDLTKSNSYL